MIHRFLILSTVILAAAFSAPGAGAQVKAPEAAFHPAAPWQVAPVSGEEAGCAMTGKFNNGFVLGFQGGDDVERLSVDFRQDVFEAGKIYDVTLQVPGVKSVSLPGQAESASLLAIGLPAEEEIYAAMRQSGVADLMIEGNDFRFYLSGIAQASDRLETCFSGGGAAEEEADPVIEEAATPEAWDPDNLLAQEEDAEAAPAAGEEDFNVDFSDEALGLVQDERFAQKAVQPAIQPEPEPEPEPQPQPQPVAAAPPVEAAPEIQQEALAAPPPRTQMQSPDMIVHKNTIAVEADFSQEPAAGEIPFTPRKADPDMIRKISELERMAADLKQENAALNSELNNTLQAARTEQVAISSQNWNLERATARYNEAERQIKNLGQDLQKERARCTAEKREIEAMLFDPQVTNQQQMARLAELEQKLRAAYARINTLQERLGTQ